MTKTTSFQTTDMKLFATVAEARRHELIEHFNSTGSLPENTVEPLVETLIESADKIVDLLTMKPTSRPAARKINRKKGSRTSASAAPATADQGAVKEPANLL